MRSMDSTGEKHIVLCIHFQYPAPTAARRPPEVLTAPSIPGVGQLHTCPSLGSSSYCLMLPLPFPTYLHFLHYAQIALTLGYWVPWKYRKGSFQSKSPFTAQPSTSAPPGNRMWILGWSTIWIELYFIRKNFSGLRVERKTNTHKSRIKESRRIGIGTQQGQQWPVQLGWDWRNLLQRQTGKQQELPSAILANHDLQFSLEQASIVYVQ